jgi:type I site-specific restriction endonuclease
VDERDARRNREASERLDRLTREGYKAAVDQAFEAQKSGMRLSRRFFENWVETLDDHAELNRRTLGNLQRLVREQREVFKELSRESNEAYDGFLDSLDAYQEDMSHLQDRED